MWFLRLCHEVMEKDPVRLPSESHGEESLTSSHSDLICTIMDSASLENVSFLTQVAEVIPCLAELPLLCSTLGGAVIRSSLPLLRACLFRLIVVSVALSVQMSPDGPRLDCGQAKGQLSFLCIYGPELSQLKS